MRALLLAGLLGVCLVGGAWGHGGDGHGFTEEEIAWMNRQRSVGPLDVKCCDEHDVYVGVNVRWRPVRGRPDRFEVFVVERQQWMEVPPGRMLQKVPGDPSPWGGEAVLFYSVYGDRVEIWCFQPEGTLY